MKTRTYFSAQKILLAVLVVSFSFLMTVNLTHASGVDFSNGLVSYWDLDETSGTRSDSEGSNNLTDNNTVTYNTGVVGNAADFEESNDEYLSISDASQSGLDITGDISIAMWVNMESTSTHQIFAFKYHGNSNKRAYAFYWDNGGNLTACLSQVGSVPHCKTQAYSFSTNTWYHVAFTWDSTNDIGKMFVNGQQVSSNLTYGISSINNNDQPFYLGTNEYIQTFDGLMDEAAVWNRTLTNYEVLVLYALGNSGYAFPEN